MYKILKLTGGTEIIGKVSKHSDQIIVNKPLQIMYRFFQNVPYPVISVGKYAMLSAEDDVHFEWKDVLQLIEPRAAFVDYYKAIVDTTYDQYNEMLDREFTLATNQALTGESVDRTAFYKALLENFQTDMVN